MKTQTIQGLGPVKKDSTSGWHYSKPLLIPVLGGKKRKMIVEGYDEDSSKDDFHKAIANFLGLDSSALKQAEPYVFKYYEDTKKRLDLDQEECVIIKSPNEVWRHVLLANEPMVTRRAYGDKGIYISLECGCDWEPEHGLQIVFKNGIKVCKVGHYDGHLTNSDAYADKSLENVVYR